MPRAPWLMKLVRDVSPSVYHDTNLTSGTMANAYMTYFCTRNSLYVARHERNSSPGQLGGSHAKNVQLEAEYDLILRKFLESNLRNT